MEEDNSRVISKFQDLDQLWNPADVLEELAECLHSLKRTTEAQLYFELAYRELSADEWVKDNQPVKLKRMKDLAKAK